MTFQLTHALHILRSHLTKFEFYQTIMLVMIASVPASGLIGRSGPFVSFALAVISACCAMFLSNFKRSSYLLTIKTIFKIQPISLLGLSFIAFILCLLSSAILAFEPTRSIDMAMRLIVIGLGTILIIYQWKRIDFLSSNQYTFFVQNFLSIYVFWILFFSICAYIKLIFIGDNLFFGKPIINVAACISITLIAMLCQKQTSRMRYWLYFSIAFLLLIIINNTLIHSILALYNSLNNPYGDLPKALLLAISGGFALLIYTYCIYAQKQIIKTIITFFIMISIPVFILAYLTYAFGSLNGWPLISDSADFLPLIDQHRESIWATALQSSDLLSLIGIGAGNSRFIAIDQFYFYTKHYTAELLGHSASDNLFFLHAEEAMPLHPHNIVLELWLETGWFGVITFCVFISAWLIKILSLPKPQALTSAAFTGAALCAWVISYSFWTSWFHVWIAGSAVVLLFGLYQNRFSK